MSLSDKMVPFLDTRKFDIRTDAETEDMISAVRESLSKHVKFAEKLRSSETPLPDVPGKIRQRQMSDRSFGTKLLMVTGFLLTGGAIDPEEPKMICEDAAWEAVAERGRFYACLQKHMRGYILFYHHEGQHRYGDIANVMAYFNERATSLSENVKTLIEKKGNSVEFVGTSGGGRQKLPENLIR